MATCRRNVGMQIPTFRIIAAGTIPAQEFKQWGQHSPLTVWGSAYFEGHSVTTPESALLSANMLRIYRDTQVEGCTMDGIVYNLLPIIHTFLRLVSVLEH